MASIQKETLIRARPDHVWAALRDWGALHEKLVPGFVTETKVEGQDRLVTFFDGTVVREHIVGCDEDAKRLAWAITHEPFVHYNAAAQVHENGGGTRFVWTADVLPHELADRTSELMERGLDVIRRTLEERA